MHPLDGIRAKIKRGEEHLNTLNREIDRIFTKRKNPPRFGVRHEFHPEDQTFRIVISAVDQLPAKLGTLVGDAVHNFRSALDQLVFELAFIDTGGKEVETTAFPASLTIDNFRSTYVQTRLLGGLTLKHRAMVKRFQPYRSPPPPPRQHHVLTLLDNLSNDDKHRLLQPLLISPQGFQFEFPGDLQGQNCYFPGPKITFETHNFIGRPLQSETEIFAAPLVVTGPNPEMPVECIAAIIVGLRDSTPIQDALEAIAPFVRRIVDVFAPEFETRKALRVREQPRFGRFHPPTHSPAVNLAIVSRNPETEAMTPIPIALV